jgi:hypothetical protein
MSCGGQSVIPCVSATVPAMRWQMPMFEPRYHAHAFRGHALEPHRRHLCQRDRPEHTNNNCQNATFNQHKLTIHNHVTFVLSCNKINAMLEKPMPRETAYISASKTYNHNTQGTCPRITPQQNVEDEHAHNEPWKPKLVSQASVARDMVDIRRIHTGHNARLLRRRASTRHRTRRRGRRNLGGHT